MVENEKPTLRTKVGEWVESAQVRYFIITLIIINAITLGMELSPNIMARYGAILDTFDDVILGVFVLEIALKWYAFGWRFWKSGWNVFDFVIVAIALMPASGVFSVLRVLRILRVLRLIAIVPQLRFVIEALLHAIPAITSTFGLLAIFYYVFAVIGTKLFGEAFPKWFGTLGDSMYTLFQIMTLEGWSMNIARPVMEKFPHAWVFFVLFILIATFTMLNLFVAIIVDTMQSLRKADQDKTRADIEAATQAETKTLEAEIQVLQAEIRELKTLVSGPSKQ
jgi:voltage-gated sodium channel